MPANLALHRADVLTNIDDHSSLRTGLGIAARRGEIKLVDGTVIVAQMRFARIVELDPQRVYRIEGTDGETWLIRRTGGCKKCNGSDVWPIPE